MCVLGADLLLVWSRCISCQKQTARRKSKSCLNTWTAVSSEREKQPTVDDVNGFTALIITSAGVSKSP